LSEEIKPLSSRLVEAYDALLSSALPSKRQALRPRHAEQALPLRSVYGESLRMSGAGRLDVLV
jgi:hypothetical protein